MRNGSRARADRGNCSRTPARCGHPDQKNHPGRSSKRGACIAAIPPLSTRINDSVEGSAGRNQNACQPSITAARKSAMYVATGFTESPGETFPRCDHCRVRDRSSGDRVGSRRVVATHALARSNEPRPRPECSRNKWSASDCCKTRARRCPSWYAAYSAGGMTARKSVPGGIRRSGPAS